NSGSLRRHHMGGYGFRVGGRFALVGQGVRVLYTCWIFSFNMDWVVAAVIAAPCKFLEQEPTNSMTKQHSSTTTSGSSREDYGLREMTASMLRFTNAVTLFSMQQVQNALGAMTDSQAAINQFCDTLDSLSNALSNRIDDSKKSTLNRMTKTGADI